MDGHAPFNAAVDGACFVEGKIVAGLVAQQDENLFELVFGALLMFQRGSDPGESTEGVGNVCDELGRHFGRGHLVVHQTGGNRAARHAVELGGIGILRHDHAAFSLDVPQAQGAVAAGAGEYDADGPLALVLG